MEADEYLNSPELMSLYAEYQAAQGDVVLAETAVEKDYRGAAEWHQRAAEAVEGAISDLDALEVNVFLATTLLADRFAIVNRLRAQTPPVSWARIGAVMGMSRQSAHEWHGNGNLRPRADNPTKQARE